jgi:hypothetical protein
MASNHFDSSPGAFASQSQSNNQQRTASSSEPSASGSKKSKLRVEFEPCDHSVVCGQGKGSFNHVGNRRFRMLASVSVDRYSNAATKAAKSAIVSEIIAVIRQAGGTFCKYENESNAWIEVGDHYAREKVSALLRDLLHTQYRSSAKAKIGRRSTTRRTVKEKQHLKPKSLSGQKRVEGTEDSDDSSTTSSTSACWGRSKDSLGFEFWLEESDVFFVIDVF